MRVWSPLTWPIPYPPCHFIHRSLPLQKREAPSPSSLLADAIKRVPHALPTSLPPFPPSPSPPSQKLQAYGPSSDVADVINCVSDPRRHRGMSWEELERFLISKGRTSSQGSVSLPSGTALPVTDLVAAMRRTLILADVMAVSVGWVVAVVFVTVV